MVTERDNRTHIERRYGKPKENIVEAPKEKEFRISNEQVQNALDTYRDEISDDSPDCVLSEVFTCEKDDDGTDTKNKCRKKSDKS